MKNDKKTLIINGAKIIDIPTFFEEVNDVFMADEDWSLAQSLDAFEDMLYGAYGKINGDEKIDLIWKDIETSKRALGVETTKSFYENKLLHPEVFDTVLIRKSIENLVNGTGQTYFEIIMEIIEGHSNITLIQE